LSAFVDDSEEPGLAVGLYDLVQTFQKVLERARNRPRLDIEPEEITTAQMIERLRDRLAEARGALPLDELFELFHTRRALISLFLAILEMVRLQAVVLRQKETFGPIYLRKHRGFHRLYTNEPLERLLQGDAETSVSSTESGDAAKSAGQPSDESITEP